MKLPVLAVSQLDESDIVGSLTNFSKCEDCPRGYEKVAVLCCHIDTDFRGPLCLRLHSPQSEDEDIFYRAGSTPLVIKSDALAKATVRTVYMGNPYTRLPELYEPSFCDGNYFYFEIVIDSLTQFFNAPEKS